MADQTMQQPAGYAQPQYGQPQYGQPQYGQPQYGQPQPGATVIVVQQGGPTRCPEAEQILTAGLCGCCDDCETCLCATFCWPCAFGTYVERAQLGTCCGSCCMYTCCCVLWWTRPCLACYAGNMRSSLFQKVGLPDPGCCINWLCHCCCTCCALAQEGRAAKKLWMMNGGAAGKPMDANAQR